MKMRKGEGSKYLGIWDGRIIDEATRYENKEEDAGMKCADRIPVDNTIDNLYADIMDLRVEEMSDSRYEQSSSRREREIECNGANQSYRDNLDLVHDSFELSSRDSLQDDTEISISRTHEVANLVSLNLSCASSGSESGCIENHRESIRNIESSDEKDRFQHKDDTHICKRDSSLLLQTIIQTTVRSDGRAKTLGSIMGIRCRPHDNLRKMTKMDSKEKMPNENTGPGVDSSNMHGNSDINTVSSLNQVLPSKDYCHGSITNTSKKEHSIHQENTQLLSEASKPSPFLIAISKSLTSSPSAIPNSSTSPQEPFNIRHEESGLLNEISPSPLLQSNFDTHSESSNQLEPGNIINFQYPMPNIIIQTSSDDSLPQKAPSTKFSIKLKPSIDYLVPSSNNPLSDITSADKVYDKHELVNIKDPKETEHHYTSHLNWWDNVRTRLIQKYEIDRDRSISDKYASDLRGMRYILKNPFDKSTQQTEQSNSVIELISKKIRQTDSTSEVNNSQASDITENRGVAGNNLSKEIKMNKARLKHDRNNAKKEISKDKQQRESLGATSEKKPRRIVKSFSKSMTEDRKIIKKKQNESKDQDIKKNNRSSSNSHHTDTRSTQPSLTKHTPLTQSTNMSLHSKNRSHDRLPSIRSKDTTSFNIHSRTNLNISSITPTIDGSFEKKTSHQKLNSNGKTDTTRKAQNLETISIKTPSDKYLYKKHRNILKSPSSNSSSEVLSISMISKITDSKYTPSRDDSFSMPKNFKTTQSLPKFSSSLGPLRSIKPLESYKRGSNKSTLSKKVLSNYKYMAYLDTDFSSSPNQMVLLYPDIKVTTAQDLTKAYGVTMETIKNKVMPISSSLNI